MCAPPRRRPRLWAALLAPLVFGCPAKAEPLIETLELVGCRDLRAGPICEIEGPTKLVIWVKVKEGARLTLTTEAGPTTHRFEPYEDGYRTHFVATATAGAVIIEAKRKGLDRRRWPLELHEKSAGQREAERLLAEGKQPEATEKWKSLADAEGDDPRTAAEALRQLGALAAQRGEIASARAHWARSVEFAQRAGLVARVVNERLSIAQTAIDADRDLALAERILDEVEGSLAPEDILGAIHLRYYRAALAMRTGDLRTAQAATRFVRRAAARVERAKTDWAAALLEGQIEGQQGRYAEQREVLEALRNHEVTRRHPCNLAVILRGLTWAAVLEGSLTGNLPASGLETAREVLGIYEGSCPDKDQAGNSAINLGLLEVLGGEVAAADRALEKAKALGAESALDRRLWLRELEARIALAKGDHARALDRYEALAEESAAASPAATWRALVGKAGALSAAGSQEEALAAYRAAASILRTESLAVALDGSRSHFLASRRQATHAELELLRSMGRDKEVMEVARDARAQSHDVLATAARLQALTPAERTQWASLIEGYRNTTRSLEQALDASWGAAIDRGPRDASVRESLLTARREALDHALTLVAPPPRSRAAAVSPDEVLLLYEELTNEVVLGCAETQAKVRCLHLNPRPGERDSGALGQTFLDPFSEELSRAKRVRLLVDGPLFAADLHAARWREQPLAVSHLVRYSVDGGGATTAGATNRALVVADPRGDLPEARTEGRWVRQRLQSQGPAELLAGPEATRSGLLAALARVSHLHFAGHSVADPAGGLESALLLAEQQALTAGELLTLPQVPKTIVLSSCEGTGHGATALPQVGLAEAFALAGAESIVGPSRPVADRLARAFVEALYEAPPGAFESAYQAAIRRLSAQQPPQDWQAFRMVGQ